MLIVDDDKQLAFGVSCRLKAGGYCTRIAESEEQGLADATASRLDLILMDVMMPGIARRRPALSERIAKARRWIRVLLDRQSPLLDLRA